jgi:hypothetical protein
MSSSPSSPTSPPLSAGAKRAHVHRLWCRPAPEAVLPMRQRKSGCRTFSGNDPSALRCSSSSNWRDRSLSRLDFLGGLRLTSTLPMRASPLMVITGPPGTAAPVTVWSNPPMMPIPVTRTVASSGTVISQQLMIAITWMDTSGSQNCASRMSMSPAPTRQKTSKSFGTTHVPLREKPPRMEIPACDVGSPSYLRMPSARAATGTGT